MNLDLIKNFFKTSGYNFLNSTGAWFMALSERTLGLLAIAILHGVFVPNYVAFLNGVTDKLPNLDTYILLLCALGIMNLRAIISKDMIAVLIHMLGFISQLAILAFVLLK